MKDTMWEEKTQRWIPLKEDKVRTMRTASEVSAADHISPDHYKGVGGLEVIDVIEAFGLQKDYYLATAIKYVLRAGKKSSAPAAEDIAKAVWFLERALRPAIPVSPTPPMGEKLRRTKAPAACHGLLPETKQTEHLADGVEDSG